MRTPATFTLHLKPVDGGPFNNMPARNVELKPDDIYANDVALRWDFNPYHTRLFVIGHEFGALCAVWATEHELLDVAVDLNLMDCFQIEQEKLGDYETGKDSEGNPEHSCAFLGNASEPFDLDTGYWSQEVDLSGTDPETIQLLCAFAYAEGAAVENLGKI